MLDTIEELLHLRGIPFARLDGATLRPRRTLDIKMVCVSTVYETDDSPYTH
jgi:hypothetical protein